ncbi:diadenylate cyclase [Patescibacteria group bacterium]
MLTFQGLYDPILQKWNFYFTDIFDILLVALLIYTFFVFIRKTRTYTVFLGLTFAATLYFVAKTFNLYLTFITLKYFVGVSFIVFVIIFQSEIRKYFEFLGLIGSRQIKVGPLAARSPSTTDIIQSCVQMAQTKTGAIIVIQGRDNIEHIIDGGTPIDAVISEEIIMSIFDPHSDGHDGAVIIRNNRISKFKVQLPLSTNFKELGKRGTRHSSALGLSEIADVLCIVVSEEKGKISICKDGKLKTLSKFYDLEKELDKYIKEKFATKANNTIEHIFRHNFWLKLGAFIIAMVLWFFTAYQAGIVEKSFEIPINIEKLPKDVVVENYNPKEIKITVSGRGDATFANLSEEDFKIIYDATYLKNGVSKEPLVIKNIVLPSNLNLISFDPESFLITAKKYVMAEIPVTAKVKGNLGKNYELKKIEVTPDIVEIWIPEDEDIPTELVTETIDVSDQTESIIIPAKVSIPEDFRFVNGDEFINVALTIEER